MGVIPRIRRELLGEIQDALRYVDEQGLAKPNRPRILDRVVGERAERSSEVDRGGREVRGGLLRSLFDTARQPVQNREPETGTTPKVPTTTPSVLRPPLPNSMLLDAGVPVIGGMVYSVERQDGLIEKWKRDPQGAWSRYDLNAPSTPAVHGRRVKEL